MRDRGAVARRCRSAAQGHDYSSRHGAGRDMQLPIDDKHTYRKDYLDTRLAIMMGGRVAEELFLNTMTTGAGNDIEQATELARKMVCEFGMSGLGPITFGKKEEQIFLGREIYQHRDFSEETGSPDRLGSPHAGGQWLSVSTLDAGKQSAADASHGSGVAGTRIFGCGGAEIADRRERPAAHADAAGWFGWRCAARSKAGCRTAPGFAGEQPSPA